MIEVYIGDEGERRLADELPYTPDGFFIGYCHPDELTPGPLHPLDLPHSSIHIEGIGGSHGLDYNRGLATDKDLAEGDLPGLFSGDHLR
jgi:hypothetical protein